MGIYATELSVLFIKLGGQLLEYWKKGAMALSLLVMLSSLVGCAPGSMASPGWGGLGVSEDTLYLASSGGKVFALDAESGVQKWVYPPGEKEARQEPREAGAPVLGECSAETFAERLEPGRDCDDHRNSSSFEVTRDLYHLWYRHSEAGSFCFSGNGHGISPLESAQLLGEYTQ